MMFLCAFMLENKNFGVRNGISVQKMFFLLNNAFLAIKTGFGVKNKTDNGPKFYSQTDNRPATKAYI
jgi:hypothetical protein